MDSSQIMDTVKSMINNTVDDLDLHVRQFFEKNDYYVEGFHRSYISFGIVNGVNDEVLQQAGEMQKLEFLIREYLINPILFALFHIHGHNPHRAEESKINWKHGILVMPSNRDYEKTFFYQMTFYGKSIRPNALKYTEEALFDKKFQRHSLLLNKIYIIDWNQTGNISDRKLFHNAKSNFWKKIERISLKDLFKMYLSKEEYVFCIKRIREAINNANKIMGFDSVHMFTPRYTHEVKKMINNSLLSWNLKNRQFHFLTYDKRIHGDKIVEKNVIPSDLNPEMAKSDLDKIIDNCYEAKRYKALIGLGEYAKCFITSEYLYQLFNKGEYKIEYTAIACGYFKCMEQLLYSIIKTFLDSGNYSSKIIKGVPQKYEKLTECYKNQLEQMHNTNVLKNSMVPFQVQFEKVFDIMLNPLITFLERNIDFWDISDKTQKHICKLLHNYADHCRNEHFHKDNIFDINLIKRIRENTITIILLLLGSLKIPCIACNKDHLFLYDDTYDDLVEVLIKTRIPDIYYLQFENEIIKAHRPYYQKPIEINEDGNLITNKFVFVPVSDIEEVFRNETNEQYENWLSKKKKIVISKDNYPSKVWYETRGKETKKVLLWSVM